MDHGSELISPLLEILEIEVSNILYNPGNIGKLYFLFFLSWKYWKSQFSNFILSWKYWKSQFSNLSYPGNIGKLTVHVSSYPGNIENLFSRRAGQIAFIHRMVSNPSLFCFHLMCFRSKFWLHPFSFDSEYMKTLTGGQDRPEASGGRQLSKVKDCWR